MSVLSNAAVVGGAGYQIDNSLRFRASGSARLSRTPGSAGNRKTWTWSGWVKRGSLSQTGTIWGSNFASGGFGMAFGNYSGVGVNPQVIGITLCCVGTVTTNEVFRDPSAWYHLVARFDSTQSSQADRFRLYVNGAQQTLSGNLNVTQNADYHINESSRLHVIGGESGYYNDFYMAEINHVDGQSLTPSYFGEQNSDGVWVPKKYTGTYGTNGFYLPFNDATSTTTLGYDRSGNGNNWTCNNISLTAGVTYDHMEDTPTNNYCTLSPIDKNSNASLSDANLTAANGANHAWANGTQIVTGSEKYYFECKISAGTVIGFGLLGAGANKASANPTDGYYFYCSSSNGAVYANGSAIFTVNATWGSAANDILQVAYDGTTGKFWIGKNNTWCDSTGGTSGNPGSGTNVVATLSTSAQWFPSVNANSLTAYLNFGQRPFAFSPPTGFKPLCTSNLP